jgi:ribosomal protein S24E
MELKIIDKKEQPMLSRIEIQGKLTFEGATPSANDVKKKLSSELKVDEGLIAVKKILTHFGSGNADLFAFAYLNKEDMGKIEPKPKEKKGAKPAGGEAPKEASKEEKPKEAPAEKKEEAPKKEAPKAEEKKPEEKKE